MQRGSLNGRVGGAALGRKGSGPRPASSGPEALRSGLHGLLDAHAESEYALAPATTGVRERVSGSRGTGTVLDERIVALRTEIVEVLTAWSALVMDERGAAGPGGRDVRGLVAFLLRHVDWLAGHAAGAEFRAELDQLLDSARRAFGPPPERRIAVGDCRHGDCDGTLEAVFVSGRPDASAAPSRIVCESGHVLPPQKWLLAVGLRGAGRLEGVR